MDAQQVVAVAGDWHEDVSWAAQQIVAVARYGVSTLFHVGDFGVGAAPVNAAYVAAVEAACVRHDVTVLITPGNHEDWNLIDATPPVDRVDGWGPVKWLTNHVGVLPRNHRFTMTTPAGTIRSFVSLGGAPSINYEDLTPHVDWWAQEALTYGDVVRAVEGGSADIMLAHDSPDAPYAIDKVDRICAANPKGWSERALNYAREGRRMMTEAYEGVRPRVFFHGHYHVAETKPVVVSGRDGLMVGLHMQGHTGNTVLLDLDALTVTPV